jgi:hypothetical protein
MARQQELQSQKILALAHIHSFCSDGQLQPRSRTAWHRGSCEILPGIGIGTFIEHGSL